MLRIDIGNTNTVLATFETARSPTLAGEPIRGYRRRGLMLAGCCPGPVESPGGGLLHRAGGVADAAPMLNRYLPRAHRDVEPVPAYRWRSTTPGGGTGW